MKSITHILAASDLSAPARHAVERAFLVAAETGARVSVVHAVELKLVDGLREWLGSNEADQVKQRLVEEAQTALTRLVEDPRHNRCVAAEVLVVDGAPLEVIAAQADARASDMVVVGSRGHNFLRHLLGSTASRLVRKIRGRPVLVVKKPPHEAYRRLLVAVDFSSHSLAALRFARLVAPTAEIVLLHAYEVPFEGKLAYAGVSDTAIQSYRLAARDEALRALRSLAGRAGIADGTYVPIAAHGEASQQILVHEEELDCDLVVIGKHGGHDLDELLLGSVTKHLLFEAENDVLVVSDGHRDDA